MIDHSAIKDLAEMAFWADAKECFGKEGTEGLTILLNSIRSFFSEIPPDMTSTRFVFIYPVQNRKRIVDYSGTPPFANAISVSNLSGHGRRIMKASAILVFVKSDCVYDIAELGDSLPYELLSKESLIFVNENGVDRFIIGGHSKKMTQVVTGAASNFAMATVQNLEDALAAYRKDAAEVSCPILKDVWVDGQHGLRLVFVNRPEATMRRSLERFLAVKINADVSVRSEHNTDESMPVDLIVNWFGSKFRALIEIKWLGKSLTRNSTGDKFTEYKESRSQQGADQLVGYIDREKSTEPSAQVKGYLVVFDGRRKGVIDANTPISSGSALYFRDKDIVLSRDYAIEREDFAPLIRYFLEPKSSFFAPQ